MPRVELLYFTGCPHIEAARTQLRAALVEAGLPPEWTENDDARGYGSPSILINGVDVLGAEPGAGNACLVYRGSEVLQPRAHHGAIPLASATVASRFTAD